MSGKRSSRQLLRKLGTVVMVPVILFEEFGYKPIARAMLALANTRVIQQIEKRVRGVSPYVALALFLVPAIALLPVKLAALWLIAHGQKLLGIGVIVLAKLLSTALLGRLFILTETQLMTFTWFARAHAWWRGTKQRVMEWVKASAAWQAAKSIAAKARKLFGAKKRK
jgi:hypothetical protein